MKTKRKPFTVDALIKQLKKIRREHGGDVPVLMVDDEPVVRAAAHSHSLGGDIVVYVSDR
jgi:hypothetical protein